MIKIKFFAAVTFAEILLLSFFFFLSSPLYQSGSTSELDDRKELVRYLQLTDFSIWTEARYTRHPSQTDFFSPFQDFPSSFEHFPAGSVIAPVTGARRPDRW